MPADKKLYALRDVTATVDIVPLIASSIMSKKLAAGADAIVLDVKVGDGAFMKTLDDARILAEQMVDLGQRAGGEVVCLLTDMDQPLGAAVGNALEVREAVETIAGDGPPDFTELVLDACARLLALSDLGIDVAEGRRRAEAAVADGSATAAYERWIRAQGGDPDLAALAARAGRARGGRSACRRRRAPRRARDRQRRARAGSGTAHEGRRRSTTRSGSSVEEARRRGRRGRGARRGARARRELGVRRGRGGSAAYEIGDEPPHAHGILLDVVE